MKGIITDRLNHKTIRLLKPTRKRVYLEKNVYIFTSGEGRPQKNSSMANNFTDKANFIWTVADLIRDDFKHGKYKVGYEINFNRYFYEYQPPRDLEEIEAEITTLEKEIMEMLKEVTE
jgi:hypothetical protein